MSPFFSNTKITHTKKKLDLTEKKNDLYTNFRCSVKIWTARNIFGVIEKK